MFILASLCPDLEGWERVQLAQHGLMPTAWLKGMQGWYFLDGIHWGGEIPQKGAHLPNPMISRPKQGAYTHTCLLRLRVGHGVPKRKSAGLQGLSNDLLIRIRFRGDRRNGKCPQRNPLCSYSTGFAILWLASCFLFLWVKLYWNTDIHSQSFTHWQSLTHWQCLLSHYNDRAE